MNNSDNTIEVEDIRLDVIYKNIRNIRLSVHPPFGRVTISAPMQMAQENVRLFCISKLGWIKKQQSKMKDQKIEAPKEYVSGEDHYYLGQRYIMKVVERNIRAKVVLKNDAIELYARPGATKKQKEALLQRWYKKRLKEMVLPYIVGLEKMMDVKVSEVAVRKMRSRWGTCNVRTRKIWLSSELAKKKMESIEFVLIHEMVHLLERNHNAKFKSHMSRFAPDWKHLRKELKNSMFLSVE